MLLLVDAQRPVHELPADWARKLIVAPGPVCFMRLSAGTAHVGLVEHTRAVGSDEMKHEVDQEIRRQRGDDHDSGHPCPARSSSTTSGVRFGGLPLVVLIARL